MLRVRTSAINVDEEFVGKRADAQSTPGTVALVVGEEKPPLESSSSANIKRKCKIVWRLCRVAFSTITFRRCVIAVCENFQRDWINDNRRFESSHGSGKSQWEWKLFACRSNTENFFIIRCNMGGKTVCREPCWNEDEKFPGLSKRLPCLNVERRGKKREIWNKTEAKLRQNSA